MVAIYGTNHKYYELSDLNCWLATALNRITERDGVVMHLSDQLLSQNE